MSNGDRTEEILISMARLQVSMENLMSKLEEQRTLYTEVEHRMTELETKINYAAGALATGSVIVFMALDWIKTKLGISS